MSADPKTKTAFNLKKMAYTLFFIGLTIGILISVLLSGGDRYIAVKSTAQNNLRQIASAWAQVSSNGFHAQPGDTAHKVAQLLASNAQLNNAKMYFVRINSQKNDPKAPKTIPISVTFQNPDHTWVINPDFARATLSYEFAANIPPDAPVATTPVAWTRGLRPDGTWGKDSPWEGQGGHIAFLDSHVEWFDKLSIQQGEEVLVKYGTNEPTVNIREALPPDAVILKAEPAAAGK